VQIWPISAKGSAVAFLQAAVAYYAKLGILERVMTDNGSCYRSKSFRAACKLGPPSLHQALHTKD
jgi:transposase InsO family protein